MQHNSPVCTLGRGTASSEATSAEEIRPNITITLRGDFSLLSHKVELGGGGKAWHARASSSFWLLLLMALGAMICHGYQVHQFQASLCNNSTKIHSLNFTDTTPCERKRRVCRQLATVYAGIAGALSSHRSSLSNAGVVKRTLARCLVCVDSCEERVRDTGLP